MKSLAETLMRFREDVVGAAIRAPDNYADWDTGGYKAHLANLRGRRSEMELRITHDLDKVIVIDQQLNDAVAFIRSRRARTGPTLDGPNYKRLNEGTLR